MRLAWQIDNHGNPNSLTLGTFLADPEVKEFLRDRSIINSLTFKAALNGPNIPKAEAIANSDNWVFEPPPASDDELDPPEGSASLFMEPPPTPPKPAAGSSEPPATATVSGGKRKRAGA